MNRPVPLAAVFMITTWAITSQALGANTPLQCPRPRALVIQGGLTESGIANRGFRNTTDELLSDLDLRGYEIIFLESPTAAQAIEALKTPCLEAFGFVGHGVNEDSENSDLTDSLAGTDLIFLTGTSESSSDTEEILTGVDVRNALQGRKLKLVILHSCFQGAQNNRARWKAAFGVDESGWVGWKGKARHIQTYWWQRYWK